MMYLYGYGVSKDLQAALYCLKEAAGRGNVYAQGHLAAYYYHLKLYTKAAVLAKRYCETLLVHPSPNTGLILVTCSNLLINTYSLLA